MELPLFVDDEILYMWWNQLNCRPGLNLPYVAYFIFSAGVVPGIRISGNQSHTLAIPGDATDTGPFAHSGLGDD